MPDVDIRIKTIANNAGVTQTEQALAGMSGKLSTATASTSGLTTGMAGLGKTLLGSLGPIAAFTSLTGVVAGFVKIGKDATAAAAAAEMANVKLAQSLLSSGRGAEISAGEIDKFATSLMRATNIDDEKIKDAYAAIAGFQNLPTDKMDDIVKVAADMAAMFGGDLATNATMVAGVLETGLIPRTWRFDAALKEQIQSMIQAGETGGALTLMLDELNRKYGGQAAAQVDTYTGSVKGLGIAWGEFLEIQGKAITDNVVVRETIDALTQALHGATMGQDAANRAKVAGLKITMQDIEEYSKLHGIYDINIIRLRLVEEAEKKNATAVDSATQSYIAQAKALGLTGVELENIAIDLNDYTGQLKFLLTSSKDYGNYLTTLAGLESELAEARKKGGKSVEGLTAKIVDLKNKNKDTTNAMIIDWAQASAAVNDTTRDEMENVLGLAGALGVMSKEAQAAALESWLLQKQIEMIMGLPDKIVKQFIIEVNLGGLERALQMIDMGLGGVTEFYNPEGVFGDITPPAPTGGGGNQPYWIPDPENSGHYMVNPLFKGASGGSFSGWAMVGDAPGGGKTPYTEYVYAPHGATVYNQAQMAGKSAPPMASGGYINPAWGEPGDVFRTSVPLSMYSGDGGGAISKMFSEPGSVFNPTISAQTSQAIAQIVAQAAQQASQQAIGGVIAATQPVTAAAAQISQAGQETTIATRQGTQANVRGDATMIAKLDDIKNLLERSFSSMPRQFAQAAAKVAR